MRYDPHLYTRLQPELQLSMETFIIFNVYIIHLIIFFVFLFEFMIQFFVDILFRELGTGCEISKTKSSSADMTIVLL